MAFVFELFTLLKNADAEFNRWLSSVMILYAILTLPTLSLNIC